MYFLKVKRDILVIKILVHRHVYSCGMYFFKKENRGSYMSAHVLLNLLNELGKRDKMRGLPSVLSLFRNEFYKGPRTVSYSICPKFESLWLG